VTFAGSGPGVTHDVVPFRGNRTIVTDRITSNIRTIEWYALLPPHALPQAPYVSRARFIAYGVKFASAPSLIGTIKHRLVTGCS
jgi:hypothetical protein